MSKSYLSRRKIAYDLNTSPYYTDVYYSSGSFKITDVSNEQTITFIFSSETYLRKFTEQLQENRVKISESLSKRFGYSIKCDLLSDLRLYISIEKRGFLILVNGEKCDCLESIILDGQNLTTKN